MRLLDELNHLGVTLITRADDITIEKHSLSYSNYRGQRRRIEADHIIVDKGASGDTALAEQFAEVGIKTHTIGDCNGVGYIEGAMESAAVLVAQLD